ncbi:hypothetical protein [Nonomuraea endophytica]|uniref:Tetratricopeptide repeat protein n=1 Tax=Nonomuraea endophytica TaxID=714136 RepID=A0A7W8AC90_9ACTN|nr:hypothetical protein [Nonomuraea endophytica]MBB5083594.1 hypothetical protein [Nonomuraea endophytica]
MWCRAASTGRWTSSIEAVEEALPQLEEIHRDSPATLLHVVAHMREADTAAAMDLLERVAALDPEFAATRPRVLWP